MNSVLGEFLHSVVDHVTLDDGPYETFSGLALEKFLSVWPLIEDGELYNQLLDCIADAIFAKCEENGIDVVVGCTLTVMNIFEGLRERAPAGLQLVYLGSHPLQKSGEDLKELLAHRRVFVFADVQSTGQLVSEICTLVMDHEGQIVMTEALYKVSNDITGVKDFDELKVRGDAIPFFAYCPVRIPTVDINKTNNISRIDMETVYPVASPQSIREDPAFDPILDFVEAVNSSPNEICSVGYFLNKAKTFSIYADIDRLFELGRVEIEAQLGTWIDDMRVKDDDPIIVTTPTAENRRLVAKLEKYFQEHKIKTKFVFFQRNDDLEGSFPYRFLDRKKNSVTGRNVIVLLSTVHSSDTLRALSAQLSFWQCKKINILTIVNRMTPASASFVSRIFKLRDVQYPANPGSEKTPSVLARGSSEFNFQSVYRIWDLSVVDLQRSERFIQSRFESFSRKNQSNVLETILITQRRFFQPLDIDTARGGIYKWILPETAAEVSKYNFPIVSALRAFARNREMREMLSLLSNGNLSRRQSFALLTILLADLPTVSSQNSSEKLSEALLGLLSQEQLDDGFDKISDTNFIRSESSALVMVGITAPILFPKNKRTSARHQKALLERLLELVAIVAQNPYSIEAISRLRNRDWCFGLAFAFGELSEQHEADSEVEEMVSALDILQTSVDRCLHESKLEVDQSLETSFKEYFVQNPPRTPSTGGDLDDRMLERELLADVHQGVTSLRDNFTQSSHSSLGFCIRSIRQQILWTKPHHSEIGRGLHDYSRELILRLREAEIDDTDTYRIDFASEKDRVGKAITELRIAVANTSDILALSRKLIENQHSTQAWTKEFLEFGPGTVENERARLDLLLENARSTGVLALSNAREIVDKCDSILSSIYGTSEIGSNSTYEGNFTRFLCSHEIKLRSFIEDAIQNSTSNLMAALNLPEPPDVPLNWNISGMDQDKMFVLTKPDVLRQTLDNFIQNFRHSYDLIGSTDGAGNTIGEIDIVYDPDRNGLSLYGVDTLEVRFKNRTKYASGPVSFDEFSTWGALSARLAAFDCEVFALSDGSFLTVTVVLPRISRVTMS